MINRTEKAVNLIITYINNIRLKNTSKSHIDGIEFEFRDKEDCYKTDEFKQLLDDYCKKNNITYEMNEVSERVAHFKMKLNQL